jgi:hypothetical protein
MHLPKLLIKRLDQFLQTPRAKSTGMTNKSELLRHVINKFLDEQDTFYNNIEYVEDFISEMKERDHMTLTFNNEIQFKEIVNAFVKRGINYNQINILLIYRKEEQKYLRTLDKIPNINSLFNSQEITIIPADDGFHNDSFFVEPIIKNLLSIMSLAKQRSKRGLNVLGTLPGNDNWNEPLIITSRNKQFRIKPVIDRTKKKLDANVEVAQLSADQINNFTEFEIRYPVVQGEEEIITKLCINQPTHSIHSVFNCLERTYSIFLQYKLYLRNGVIKSAYGVIPRKILRTRGTGLGLLISKNIVETHGGNMWAVYLT